MYLDKGRQFDLEELQEGYDKAQNSIWKDQHLKKIDGIMRESGAIREARNELIKAIRSGDKRHVHYVNQKLRRIRLDETYGHRDH